MLLEFPNPKDPQDAEVAAMMISDPARFARVAHDWAVRFAGAPKNEFDASKYEKGNGAAAAKEEDPLAKFVAPRKRTRNKRGLTESTGIRATIRISSIASSTWALT
jgi:ubiquitin-conjugating enzyme (huntingtin interacting protein 2)